ncbi:MAG: phosphoribosylaminoimidazolecarboxamide formyltransferase [Gammaproteobacteria bacterium]|nr:phosphoribosylaminoimidazolecarboxamide formyltransferase [Gammaproteobacteria bacterium]MXY55085.1 phosphoribosylaminoimidazolecarboxamide formyltransferase [Gammaproteobacteria bacterium]MYF27877.1 phosphoribosylaminoimidazolecarboxamide formyltransferase [Gammaproteobacteria bacterium]MYK48576.1 phosphoribosylaminoimidazolecarboxamide formyltransferase [Gammaproteobacteria bacterium]
MPALKYGCNPHQAQAAFESDAVRVRNGAPSMINMLDALNGWQLAAELSEALDAPAAASFKHVSPAGAAVGVPLSDDLRRVYEVGGRDLSPLATAYVRARGADPKSSFGDFVALSHPVDAASAGYLKGVVSDGIVAPGFEEGTLATLAAKKGGSFVVIETDPDYRPPAVESRQVFGVTLTQERNDRRLRLDDLDDLVWGELSDTAKRDLLLALVTLKYTQSNSVGYALDGQMIGIGAGQQSRVDCTRLAGAKADVWHLSRHPKVLGIAFRPGVRRQERINWRVRYIEGDLTPGERTGFTQAVVDEPQPLVPDERAAWLAECNGVALASDGFIPFRDNIDHAARHGVSFIAQPGGSTRDAEVAEACREHGIAMVHTGLRLFHH